MLGYKLMKKENNQLTTERMKSMETRFLEKQKN